ncbi:ArnT family glycosyltransferase [Candidatus Frankia alpina]|uniref:ArnT family glycosyltransferase n=1 Tax=Candidatus Frankia alpina TaxID=2699483 RepID=UPI003AF7E022
MVHGVNFDGWPGRVTDDEGTYAAQAYSMQYWNRIAHYTYWYDHPFGGWLLIAIYTKLTDGFHRAATAVTAVRELMFLLHLASCVLLYRLGRLLGLRRFFAGLALLVFSLSPLALWYQRMAFLDNIGVMWLLAAFVCAASPRRSVAAAALAGTFMAFSFWSKETTLLFLPGLYVLLWQHWDPRNWRFVRRNFLGCLLGICGIYILYAAAKNELFEGPGHVSLEWAVRWQLFDRAPSGQRARHRQRHLQRGPLLARPRPVPGAGGHRRGRAAARPAPPAGGLGAAVDPVRLHLPQRLPAQPLRHRNAALRRPVRRRPPRRGAAQAFARWRHLGGVAVGRLAWPAPGRGGGGRGRLGGDAGLGLDAEDPHGGHPRRERPEPERHPLVPRPHPRRRHGHHRRHRLDRPHHPRPPPATGVVLQARPRPGGPRPLPARLEGRRLPDDGQAPGLGARRGPDRRRGPAPLGGPQVLRQRRDRNPPGPPSRLPCRHPTRPLRPWPGFSSGTTR